MLIHLVKEQNFNLAKCIPISEIQGLTTKYETEKS